MSKKRKRKRVSKESGNSKSSDSASSNKLLSPNSERRNGKPIQVAIALASLAAGLMFLINLDRVTNSAAARQMDPGTSLHGWPFIYLERHYETLPAFLTRTQGSDWAYPPVEGEIRTLNYANLALDGMCGLVIVIISYFIVWAVVSRYENWKNSW